MARFRRTPQDFDIIITDWAMPGMSGTELVTAIREVRPDIPMLLISGFVGALVEKTAKMTGIGEVLVRPVNPELLAQAVAWFCPAQPRRVPANQIVQTLADRFEFRTFLMATSPFGTKNGRRENRKF